MTSKDNDQKPQGANLKITNDNLVKAEHEVDFEDIKFHQDLNSDEARQMTEQFKTQHNAPPPKAWVILQLPNYSRELIPAQPEQHQQRNA
ncbi:hypothetical protein [Endozoicomonas sp.]|uniref:hypothetical protein n=1 Tax=Endozoicomonas sp. TaxID=1892382 RepID=UPI003AF6D55B